MKTRKIRRSGYFGSAPDTLYSQTGEGRKPAHSCLATALVVALFAAAPHANTALPLCEGDPLFVTEDCDDPLYTDPYIDVSEVRQTPVPHHYVNGHFQNTDTRFSFYFPLEGYEGRFFQFTHQFATNEQASAANIRFAIESGAYLVQTNQGGGDSQYGPTVGGYRVNAAAAKFSREVAADIFGEHRPFGYLSGGSGGAFQTIASMQNTTVWDGGAPYVMGTPQAIPNVYTVRVHALRVLRDGETSVFPAIMDAIDPGGSGDPYATLNQEQREALEEVTRMGFPMRGWFGWETMTTGALPFVAGSVRSQDPEYFSDFWEKEGYLGHDDPYGSIAAAVAAGADPDNLALETYHRHQIPDVDRFETLPEIFPPMPAWDQFLDEEGNPLYPQRDVLVGPGPALSGAGSLQSGHFHGKMIGLQTMMDIDAFPWKGDWYREQVHEAGNGERYRLYFIDHAPHGANVSGASQARLVGYRGALEQTILDLAAWVEDDIEPPKETKYTMDEAQVLLPPSASARRGIQPVVHLKANGGARADIQAGGQVRFQARIEVPQNVGEIVQAEWDFYGTGEFVPINLKRIQPGTVNLQTDHIYMTPGAYFPVLRATSHRAGDPNAVHARIQNIGRARVVVTGAP